MCASIAKFWATQFCALVGVMGQGLVESSRKEPHCASNVLEGGRPLEAFIPKAPARRRPLVSLFDVKLRSGTLLILPGGWNILQHLLDDQALCLCNRCPPWYPGIPCGLRQAPPVQIAVGEGRMKRRVPDVQAYQFRGKTSKTNMMKTL